MPRTSTTVTISLDPAMAEEVEKVRKAEHCTTSELWRQAMRAFLRTRTLREYTPTRAELRSIEKGRAEIRRGDYLTLDDLRAYLAAHPPKVRAKDHRSRTAPRARKTARRA
jgi:predicted transcriptional regulator